MLSRLAGLSLAAALVAAAPASAMPDEPAGTGAEQRDMHASTVQKQDGTQQSGIADARGEAAAGSGTAGASGGPVPPASRASRARRRGPCTRRRSRGPRSSRSSVPSKRRTPFSTSRSRCLLSAGTLALGGGMAAVALKARGRTRTAH